MTKQNPSSLRISSGHYRTADLVIAVAFILAGILGGYFAIAHEVRDFWLLLVVGIVGGILLLKKARTPEN